jgi:hypothetical protein
MDDNTGYLDRARRLTADSVVQAVVEGLSGGDRSKLEAIAKSRQERQQEIVLDGAKYWSFLAPGFSQGIEKQSRADLYYMLICRDRPSRHHLCILGNISYVVGRKIQWDPVAERIVGDEERSSPFVAGSPRHRRTSPATAFATWRLGDGTSFFHTSRMSSLSYNPKLTSCIGSKLKSFLLLLIPF